MDPETKKGIVALSVLGGAFLLFVILPFVFYVAYKISDEKRWEKWRALYTEKTGKRAPKVNIYENRQIVLWEVDQDQAEIEQYRQKKKEERDAWDPWDPFGSKPRPAPPSAPPPSPPQEEKPKFWADKK